MSRIKKTVILGALIAGVATVSGLAETASDAEPVGSYHLKRKSTFNAPENARAPFWPIGHVKRVKSAPVETTYAAPSEKLKFEPEMFAVTSIVLGNPSLAIINGRAYGEGEFLRPPRPTGAAAAKTLSNAFSDPRNRVRVMRIGDGQVVLQSADNQQITVPLKRPELPERRGEPAEALLEQDR